MANEGSASASSRVARQEENGELPGLGDDGKHPLSRWKRVRSSLALDQTVNHDDATVPLAWMAMLTGLVDGAIYSRAEIWTGFQTGNTVQVALGITTYIFPQTTTSIPREPLLLLLRSLSLVAFFLAGLTGSRMGNRWGHTRRGYLAVNAVLQGALLFAAAGILWSRPDGEELTYQWWPAVILLIAFSMGMQSILAQKIASPVFATSVAFTASMTQLASDRNLFSMSTSLPCPLGLFSFSSTSPSTFSTREASHQLKSTSTTSSAFFGDTSVRGRDLRILALICLATGGGVAQSLLEPQTGVGLRGVILVAGGCKVFLSLLWFIPKGKK